MASVSAALAVVLSVAVVGSVHVRVQLAAGAAARAAARGETAAEVAGTAQRLAGPGAVSSSSADGSLVTVVVQRPVRVPLPGAGALEVRASAAALVEDAGPGGDAVDAGGTAVGPVSPGGS